MLVSGTGDGGLADVFRASIAGFSMGEFFRSAVLPNIGADLIRDIRAVERRLQDGDVAGMQSFYRDLRVPRVITAIAALRRDDTIVSINGTGATPFSPAACPLNRFVLSQLLATSPTLQYLRGRLSDPVAKSEAVVLIDGKECSFDQVMVRHGPRHGLAQMFPSLAGPLERLKEGIRASWSSDPLRVVHWPAKHFAEGDDHHGLASRIDAATSRIQPSRLGDIYAGGELYVEHPERALPIPHASHPLAIVSTDGGPARVLRETPLTHLRIRERYPQLDLPESG